MSFLTVIVVLFLLIGIPVIVSGPNINWSAGLLDEHNLVVLTVHVVRFYFNLSIAIAHILFDVLRHIQMTLYRFWNSNLWHRLQDTWNDHNDANAVPSNIMPTAPTAPGGSHTNRESFNWGNVGNLTAAQIEAFDATCSTTGGAPSLQMPSVPTAGRSPSPTMSDISETSLSSVTFTTTNSLATEGIHVHARTPPPAPVRERRMVFPESNMWYAVIVGLEPGVYFSWSRAAPQIYGISGNEYRTYKTEEEARMYFELQKGKGRLQRVSQ